MKTKEILRQLYDKIQKIYWEAADDCNKAAEMEVDDIHKRFYKQYNCLGRMEAINDIQHLINETIDSLD